MSIFNAVCRSIADVAANLCTLILGDLCLEIRPMFGVYICVFVYVFYSCMYNDMHVN